jgi:hypothetical protein
MKMHPLTQAAVLAIPLLAALLAAPLRAGERERSPSADADSAPAAKPTSGLRATWFDRALASASFGREDAVDADTVFSNDEPAESLATPRLGPLSDQDMVVIEGPLYEGPIVDLTDGPEDTPPTYGYSGQAYDLHLFPQGLIYRSYMAGAKESRFRSVWHEESGGHDIWDITLGGNVGLLRYGTRGDSRPEGIQLGIEGASLVRLDRDSNIDVAATDYRFGIPLTWGDSIYQVKFAYYHLSSHVGDEFLLSHPGYNRFNYSRDALVWGHSLYPTDRFRVYGEIGYAFYNDDCDPWETQFGIDYGPNGRTGARGAPFAAVNGHLRQEVDFGGNFVAQAGWAWRRSPGTGTYRFGVEYYNGKDDQFSFFNNSVEKLGLGMWYDY